MSTFNHAGDYQCACGKYFTNSQYFNGHKSNCKVFQIEKHGSLDVYLQIKRAQAQNSHKNRSQNCIKNKKIKLDNWISQKHQCEKCGKIMTEKYGSGRFCCRSCANSHVKSEESKQKISTSVKISFAKKLHSNSIKEINIDNYIKNPKLCQNCGKILSYDLRRRKTCCNDCAKQLRIKTYKKNSTITYLGKNIIGRHIVYKTHIKNDARYYIGVRKTNKDTFDGYLGSGVILKRLIKKYGKENFYRETLFEFDNSSDAYTKEIELLKDCLKDPNCINLAEGGQGGHTYQKHGKFCS